jgi:hypothetical protein
VRFSGADLRGIARRGCWGGIWCAIVLTGLSLLWAHTWTPGEAARAPRHWPDESSITREPGCFTLVLFAHPQCPCVRTSLTELAALPGVRGENVRTVFVVDRPLSQSIEWSFPFSNRAAAAIPNATIVDDFGCQERKRFGAKTSGETMLFNPAGDMVFHGGVTEGRGHAGSNAGAQAVQSLLEGRSAAASAQVFGCPLSVAEDNG